MTNLADARSYFDRDFENACREPAFVARKLAEFERDGEGEHVLEAVRVLARFQATLAAARKMLGKPLGLAQTTALAFLFDGPQDWGKLANHVRRSHKRAGSRNRRALGDLERAGVIVVAQGGDPREPEFEAALAVSLESYYVELSRERLELEKAAAGELEPQGCDVAPIAREEWGPGITVGELVELERRGFPTPVDGDERGGLSLRARLVPARDLLGPVSEVAERLRPYFTPAAVFMAGIAAALSLAPAAGAGPEGFRCKPDVSKASRHYPALVWPVGCQVPE